MFKETWIYNYRLLIFICVVVFVFYLSSHRINESTVISQPAPTYHRGMLMMRKSNDNVNGNSLTPTHLTTSTLGYLNEQIDLKNARPFHYEFFDCSTSYIDQCMNLFAKLRHPPKENVIEKEPPRRIPDEMYLEFTQNGDMPLRRYSYVNEAYADATIRFRAANKSTTNGRLASSNRSPSTVPIIRNTTLDMWKRQFRQSRQLGYKNRAMKQEMMSRSKDIANKSALVVGTQEVWIEAMLLELNASKITTLDYTRKQYENPKLEWLHTNDLLDALIQEEAIELFDLAASFSSIEHAGLGRYGDPLNPYGDLDAMKQIHCLVKPGGLLFLGIPTNIDESSKKTAMKGYIDFNMHRYYGQKRLQVLFKGWKLLAKSDRENHHVVYVLKKEDSC